MCGTWGIRHGLAPFARLRATNVGEPAWGDPDLPEYVSAAGLDGYWPAQPPILHGDQQEQDFQSRFTVRQGGSLELLTHRDRVR